MVADLHRQPAVTNPGSLQLAYGYETWTTAIHLDRALQRQRGCDAFGPGHNQASSVTFDAPLLWVESGAPWMPPLDEIVQRRERGHPTAAWLIDTHRGATWRLNAASAFDHVFVAQRSALPLAQGIGIRASWLPLAAPLDLVDACPPADERPFQVAFVGQVPRGSDRERILNSLRSRFTMPEHGPVGPREMMHIYRSARVVINLPLSGDLNMRTFEAAAAGALLVTNDMDGLDQVLPLGGYRLVEGRSAQAWIDAVESALGDPVAPAPEQLRAWVAGEHTYDHRAQQVMTTLDGVEVRGSDPRATARALGVGLGGMGAIGQLLEAQGLPMPVRLLRLAEASAVRSRRWYRRLRS